MRRFLLLGLLALFCILNSCDSDTSQSLNESSVDSSFNNENQDHSTSGIILRRYEDDSDSSCYPKLCFGVGVDCSPWNPGVCGSVCQMRTTSNILGSDEETEDLSEDLTDIFPDLYQLRDVLDDYSDRGIELVDNYYEIGSLYFSGTVNISVNNQINVVLKILAKTSLISEFISNKNSSNILYTVSEANDYLQIIDDLRQDSTNKDYRTLLDYFETIINTNKGETIYEIHQYLDN